MMPDPKFLERAIDLALTDIAAPHARPFGSVIVLDGSIIAEGFNTAARSNDPTAHAEVAAIRAACIRFASHRLPTRCQLYASAEPCPMCFAACYWAGIEEIYFAVSGEEQAKYGFGVEEIAARLGCGHPRGVRVAVADPERAHEPFIRFVASHPEWLASR